MPITVNSLYCDSYNFIRNHISKFILLTLIASVIQFSLMVLFQPDLKAIEQTYKMNLTELVDDPQKVNNEEFLTTLQNQVKQLSPEQRAGFLKDALFILFEKLLSTFFVQYLIMAWVLAFSLLIIRGEQPSLLRAFSLSMSRLPKMLLAGVFCGALTIMGLCLFVIPGIALYFAFSMVPIMIGTTNTTFINAISSSIKLLGRYPAAIISGALFSIAAAMFSLSVISLLLSPFNSTILTLFVVNITQSLIMIYFIIYFFRLLTLSADPTGN